MDYTSILLSKVKNIIPDRIKKLVKNYVFSGSQSVLRELHTPDAPQEREWYFKDKIRSENGKVNNFPLPPKNLRMGYPEDNEEYIRRGIKTEQSIRDILKSNKISIDEESRFMEWGCATGRVLRWFDDEARSAEGWGVDQHERSIRWNKDNLSPPFEFVTCTSYPHLPFEDGYFDFVFGISVFTHMEFLIDAWLMEIRRILRDSGYGIFTIHDENSIDFFKERGSKPFWMPEGIALSDVRNHGVYVVNGDGWENTYTVFHTEWIKHEWGKYFEVVEVRPRAEHSQSAVVLKK